jgi:hypothetical protein
MRMGSCAQVLFCTLSPPQRKLYKAYLGSKDVAEILEGRRPSMEGITTLRKICNHADLLHRIELSTNSDVDYGALDRSSKLQVTMKVRSSPAGGALARSPQFASTRAAQLRCQLAFCCQLSLCGHQQAVAQPERRRHA